MAATTIHAVVINPTGTFQDSVFTLDPLGKITSLNFHYKLVVNRYDPKAKGRKSERRQLKKKFLNPLPRRTAKTVLADNDF